MSKKRKTKRQKVASVARQQRENAHLSQTANTVEHVHTPVTYSLDVKRTVEAKSDTPKSVRSAGSKVDRYVKKDVAKIMYASAGILVFDLTLFVLLHTHLLKLGFLGY